MINPEQLGNAIQLFNREWALLSAGTVTSYNMMTVSWGGMGELWSKPVVTVYVRPQRYTLQFLDTNEFFTLSFFEEQYRDMLLKMGRISGYNANKKAIAGLTSSPSKNGSVLFLEARLSIECRKLYTGSFRKEGFLDQQVLTANYPDMDLHRIFIGEITDIVQA